MEVNVARRKLKDYVITDFHKMSQASIAAVFGLTPRSVRQWADCPRNTDGTYSLPDTIAYWRKRYERQIATAGADPDGDAGDPEVKQRIAEEKLRKLKRENDTAEGVLVSAEDVRGQLVEIARGFKSQAEGIEKTYGAHAGDAIRRLVDQVERSWKSWVSQHKATSE